MNSGGLLRRGALLASALALISVLSNVASSEPGSPALAVSTSKLLFTRYADFPGPCYACDTSIFVVSSNGSGLRKVKDQGEDPAWSPDGTKIAFANQHNIYVTNADGRGTRRVVRDLYGAESPRWSPDGRRLVIEQDCGLADTCGLVIVDINRGARRVLRGPPGSWATEPDWSPDGTRIAFIDGSAYPDPEPIYVINVDGTGLRKITQPPKGVLDRTVRWSPDGRRLLFYREGLGLRDAKGRVLYPIYTVNPDTGRLKLLFRGVYVLSVSWSPDGRRFAYAGGPVGNRIHIVDVARRRDRTLNLKPCTGEGSCHFVDWQ